MSKNKIVTQEMEGSTGSAIMRFPTLPQQRSHIGCSQTKLGSRFYTSKMYTFPIFDTSTRSFHVTFGFCMTLQEGMAHQKIVYRRTSAPSYPDVLILPISLDLPLPLCLTQFSLCTVSICRWPSLLSRVQMMQRKGELGTCANSS